MSDTPPLMRLLHYARHRRRALLAASLASVLNKLFDLAPPVLIGVAVDIIAKKEDSLLASLGVQDVMDQLIVLAILTVIVWGLESVFEYIFAILWRNLAQIIQHELRLDAYAHIQNLDMVYFHDQSTGTLMAILNDDVNQLERFLDSGANQLIQVVTTAVVITIAFFILVPGIAWMAMMPIPFVLYGSFKFQHLLTDKYAHVRERVGNLNSLLANNLTGIATIKSFTTEDYEVSRVHNASDMYRQSNKDAISLSSAFSPLIRMVIVAGFIATLVYGGHLALAGSIAIGTYSVLVFLTQRLLWPLTRLGETFDTYQRAMASTVRVLNLLQTPIAIDSGDTHLDPAQVKGHLMLKSVCFAYPDRDPIFEDFDLEIDLGTTLGIVGATGSGKTSLINLLMRFYEPMSGTITIDGMDLTTLNLKDVRRAIGLVSQSVYLFHGTIAQNIMYGSFEATQKEIEAAAKSAEAHDFIMALPHGYETTVGERGVALSGGQRQRLSIARALLKKPRILILDEATSAVDNETEAALQRSLAKITTDRTTLVIAHRLSTVRHADRIIVMEAGMIAEQGTHDKLVAHDGIYARLWRIQTGERLADSTHTDSTHTDSNSS